MKKQDFELLGEQKQMRSFFENKNRRRPPETNPELWASGNYKISFWGGVGVHAKVFSRLSSELSSTRIFHKRLVFLFMYGTVPDTKIYETKTVDTNFSRRF